MSRYGLETSLTYEQIFEFMRTTSAPARDIEFFTNIPWAHNLFKAAAGSYRTAPFYSRYGKADTSDLFFSRTIATDETIPHMLLLTRREGWGQPSSDVPSDSKQRPFTAPAVPDSVLLVDLKEGFAGFANTAHGGAMCSLLDEALGMTVLLHRHAASAEDFTTLYTAGLNVSFLAPVPTPSVLALRSWFIKRDGRKWFLRAQLVDGQGRVLLEADSVWISERPRATL